MTPNPAVNPDAAHKAAQRRLPTRWSARSAGATAFRTEMCVDRITGFDNRNRDGARCAPTNGARVVSRRIVRRCAPSNSRSSGTAALRLRLRPYDLVERLRLSPSSRGAAQLALR